MGPIDNIPALVLIMAWRRPGAKPFSEPMMARLLTHICVTRPQWVNTFRASDTCMRQWIGSLLFLMMAFRLFGTRPSPKPLINVLLLIVFSVCLMHSYLQIQLSISLIQLEIPLIWLNMALFLSNLVRFMFIFTFGIAFKLKLSSLCFYFP